MQRTNLNDLVAFITVARERSFTRAAAKLDISQSSLSHLIHTLLWPRLIPFLRRYPDIHVELITDYGLTDIVAERFDAGVWAGEQVARDIIAVRIGPDMCMPVCVSTDS